MKSSVYVAFLYKYYKSPRLGVALWWMEYGLFIDDDDDLTIIKYLANRSGYW